MEGILRLIILLLFVSFIDSQQVCKNLSQHEIPSYYNWPFSLNCDLLMNDLSNTTIDSCTIRHGNGTSVQDQLIIIEKDNAVDDASNNLLYFVVMNTTDMNCYTSEYLVTFSDLPNTECDAVVKTAHKEGTITAVETVYGQSLLMRCQDPDEKSLIPKGANPDDFATVWKRNCDTTVPGIYYEHYRIEKLNGYPDDLKVTGMNFYHVGNYTCFLKYKDEMLVALSYHICMRDSPETAFSINCPSTTVVAKHDTANVTCNGRLPRGIIPSGTMKAYLKNVQTNDILCSVDVFGQTSINGKYSCNINGPNINKTMPCENGSNGRDALSQKLGQDRNDGAISFNFLIKDVEEFMTNYTVVLELNGRPASSKNNTSLQQDWEPYYKYLRNVVLAPCLVILMLLLVILIVIWYYRLELRYILKDLCGDCSSHGNDKKYDFYFLYESDQDDKEFRQVYLAINDVVERNRYKHFDEHTDLHSTGKVRLEVITNTICNCRCLVVIVTKKMIENENKDSWARFHLQVCISTITPIKFIFFPGTRRQLRKTKGWKKISKVVKVCESLDWTAGTDISKIVHFDKVYSEKYPNVV